MEENNTSIMENQPLPTSPIPAPIHEKKSSKKNVGLIIGGIILLLILIGFGAFYFSSHQKKSMTLDKAKYIESTATPIPTQVSTFSSSLPKEYKIRHFDITEDFAPENEKYPTEITQASDDSLTPIYCTPNYTKYGDKYTSSDETNKTITLDDLETLNYIKTLEEKYKSEDRSVMEISTCAPKEDKIIILYSLGPCGGGCSGVPYVGIVNGEEIKEIANISKLEDQGMAYFGCRQPLQLTKNNIFYFTCGGGDGPGSSASIYKLSLVTEAVSRIETCNTSGTEDGNGSKTECK